MELGRTVVWLHTFGERFVDAKAGRPAGPPRLPRERAPRIPKDGAIPATPDSMPDEMRYDDASSGCLVGTGFVDDVPPAVWEYEVSGKRVLTQWFSYRKKNRERPIIGDRRPPSKLGDIQPDRWLAEYTTELLNVLHVLGGLAELEPAQAELLGRVCAGPLIPTSALAEADVLRVPETWRKSLRVEAGLFGEGEGGHRSARVRRRDTRPACVGEEDGV